MYDQKKSCLHYIAGALFLVAMLIMARTILGEFFRGRAPRITPQTVIFYTLMLLIGVGMFFADKFPVSAIGFAALSIYYLRLVITSHFILDFLPMWILYTAGFALAAIMFLNRYLKLDKFCRMLWFLPAAVYGLGEMYYVVKFALARAGFGNVLMMFIQSALMVGGLLLAIKYTADAAQPEVKANPYGYNQYGQNPYGAYNQPNNGYGAYNQPNNGYNGYNNAPMNAYNAPIEEEEATQIEGYDAPRTFDRDAEIKKYRAMLEAGYISVEEYNARIRQINGFNR